MNCHQILTGACNPGCNAVGSVEGISFTAYASGCNIIILASTFERVQIIPGAIYNYVRITALDCSNDTGKIAASYEDKMCIFEPVPLALTEEEYSTHGLDFKWVQTGIFQVSFQVASLSWNVEGNRLLVGGKFLQIWKEKDSSDSEDRSPTKSVKFEIGGGSDTKSPCTDEDSDELSSWENIWECLPATPVCHMAYSPDGTLFATCGKNDRLVKIWYEHKKDLFPPKSVDYAQPMSFCGTSNLDFGFIYIAHPRAVTHISWRKTSKNMPKGSVSNMLVTSCQDNICRIWVETILPDDGLVNMNQFDPLASQNPKFRTHRHKHRFMQRLKHMKTCFHIRRHAKNQGISFGPLSSNNFNLGVIPTLPSTYSVHDFHSYGYHGTGVTPALHFHIAASINAETDIPLVPSMQTNDSCFQPNFVLHWLNNKEMHFTIQAENLLQELARKSVEAEDQNNFRCTDNDGDVITSFQGDQVQNEDKKKKLNKLKSYSQDDSMSDEQNFTSHRSQSIGAGSHVSAAHQTLSNTTSINSLANETNTHIPDSLDMKIECLLRDWHHSGDLLYSIHPLDGSFLIWVVDWLDEYHPGSFRQAQVSFSTRIPSAVPLGDAYSMSIDIHLYNSASSGPHFRDIVLKNTRAYQPKPNNIKTTNIEEAENGSGLPSVLEESDGDHKIEEKSRHVKEPCEDKAKFTEMQTDDEKMFPLTMTSHTPIVSMVTNHSNGTLNLWQLTFSDKSKFSQVLSIGHVNRISGHRFRVNDITCHPVLPLLLTTSHHNIPELKNKSNTADESINSNFDGSSDISGFCSELILWRVDSVGPLSQSGGVSELARINSPALSAFSNVAWIPTLLPSTTLGRLSNSPSACFVASDGKSLCVYQAVIDARTLLAEISTSEQKTRRTFSLESISSESSSFDREVFNDIHKKIKIVSQQSTARPGCIIKLDTIDDAIHDWQNTQFLHVFQEQLITGKKTEKTTHLNEVPVGLINSKMEAMVDLQRDVMFEEPFYIVILEKTQDGTTIHMWRLVIASHSSTNNDITDSMLYVPDSNITQDLEECETFHKDSAGVPTNSEIKNDELVETPHVHISTTKVCTQILPLQEKVEVVHAAPAAGHLSSSSIYPACFAPYLIVTACSDSSVRFWKCNVTSTQEINNENVPCYEWKEWEMIRRNHESTIDINGQLLHVSAAYSGRIACAYKYGKSFTRTMKCDPDQRFVNLCVAIYECESTGGSEWVLEDTINLKNIHLPQIDINSRIDYSHFQNNKKMLNKQLVEQIFHFENVKDNTYERSENALIGVPSFSTLQSLRKSISEHGNTCPITQKHLVQLDWVSKEDGSHILTVAVGSKIMLYTPVSSDLAQANMKAMKESMSTNRPILRKASSLAQPHFNDEIRWMKLRQIDLTTADGLPPLPMQISWVRDGIFVAGMDSEMHVYSQWKHQGPNVNHCENDESNDKRCLRDEDLRSLAHENTQMRLTNVSSVSKLNKFSSINLQMLDKKRKPCGTGDLSNNSENINPDYMVDFGLFEAARIACPVLPQYHPKQLMELLNSGKIRWVKAILAHLVRCINSSYTTKPNKDESSRNNTHKTWSRSRTLSVSYIGGNSSPLGEPRGSTTQMPEELTLDYAEIASIPPLPLWILLAADKETVMSNQKIEVKKEYDDLFDTTVEDESLDELLRRDTDSPSRFDRRQSIPEKQGLSHFGPRQGQLLSRLLTHTHLPGLSSLDQMHLLALADTVSTCNTDFAERFANDAAKTALAKENYSGNEENISTDSLDDCGLRFLLAMKHYNYLLRCLPLSQRNMFQKQGVGTSNIVWAFHSESEEELLNLIPSYSKNQCKWSTLRELGVGYWLRNITILRQCFERLAKAAYQSKQDPLDAALYYFAMKKKSVVYGLFKSKRDEKMTAFFSNNFSEDRWRKAALKNAYALLGKQRFEHAVAFFLLANSLNDALEVCLTKLEDLQLALVITKLYEGEHGSVLLPTYKKIIYQEILGCDKDGNNQDLDRMHPDPFLRSMCYWILKDYSESLSTLLQNGVGHLHPAFDDNDFFYKTDSANTTNPNVFNFYVYLRTHPLLIRQYIASTAQEKRRTQVILAGFSYGTDQNTRENKKRADKQLLLEDTITPLERQLYFTTAHGHFKAGCPALALEVLNKLPNKVVDHEVDSLSGYSDDKDNLSNQINTGIIDWSNPVCTHNTDSDFKIEWDDDSNDEGEKSENLSIANEGEKHTSVETVKKHGSSGNNLDIMAQQLKFIACLKILMEELSTLATGYEVDGGQLRYQLYVWLEKEVDALKQLCNYSNSNVDLSDESQNPNIDSMVNEFDTPILHNKLGHEKPTLHEILLQEKQDFEAKVERAAKRKRWLKTNETLLRTLLSYCSLHGASGGGLASVRMELILLLQELQQEKTQQQLLSPLPFPTTLPLLSACVAGNKTVIADPIRALQAHTHDMLQTILNLRTPTPWLKTISEIYVLQNLAVALSACIYQSLCDSDTFSVKPVSYDAHHSPGMDNLAKLNANCQITHLMSNAGIYKRRRKYSTDDPLVICTAPSKWPGVTNLRALLAREKDDDVPRLNVLLCESFVATYMALLVCALSSCDCHTLYRMCAHQFTDATWASLFGGGVKKLLRQPTSHAQAAQQVVQSQIQQESLDNNNPESGMWNTVTSLTMQRVKLNMKLLGNFNGNQAATSMKEDKPTYREQFLPPDSSMLSYLMMKPTITEDSNEDGYDTSNSTESDEDLDDEEEEVFSGKIITTNTKKDLKENSEHYNPNSLSWAIMRLAIIKITQIQLQTFINIAGIEMQELPVASPLVHSILRSLSKWQDILKKDLENKSPAPIDFIPGIFVETNAIGPAIHKYRTLLEKRNTPFKGNASGPAKRLWNFLVKQEAVQDIFVRAIFGKRKTLISNTDTVPGTTIFETTTNDSSVSSISQNHNSLNTVEPVRIIHKDQESISAFCANPTNPGLLALATPRELQEIDVTLLLTSPNWFEDECELDIMNLNRDIDQIPASSFLVVQTTSDKTQINAQSSTQYGVQPTIQPGLAGQSGRGSSLGKGVSFPGSHCPHFVKLVINRSKYLLKPVIKHKVDNIKRMCAHPLMPLYITGGQDGSVQMWEWGHQQAVCIPRPPGTFAKVTRCRFSQHGNKFGVADGDGNLSLWQASLASQCNRSFFSYQCHTKLLSDFVFLGSCSLVATAGHSSENKNVCIWDTLLPQKKSLITTFTCHEQGASALAYAPQHQLLITTGKKGDVCLFDMRQRVLRHRFQAHDGSIKCIALDPHEEFFVTGSADGDIKVWGLSVHSQLYCFIGEHARSSFFKNIGQGVTQLHIDQVGRLLSCGADGSMKVRQLPDRESVIHTIY
ncbi:dmX-like protein 2 isoform X2 [Culicoides brevitarsis]|uniref:dmX-like protein 2 isoform X2 n=1 Tax=Culicoides brevitarsis TaxID=469753 RepID=UPI00307CA3CC